MKKWLRRTLIAALLVGVTLAALYEAATHVGRGWLAGEAFYDGRPTSYWRGKIDDWLERFDSTDMAVRSIDLVQIGSISKDGSIVQGNRSSQYLGWVATAPRPRPLPKSWVAQFLEHFRWGDAEQADRLPPKVLWGWHGAEAVLSALAEEAKYRPLTERALKNVALLRTILDEGSEPTLSFDEPMLVIV